MTEDRRRDVGEMFHTTVAPVREDVGIVAAAILVLTAIDIRLRRA